LSRTVSFLGLRVRILLLLLLTGENVKIVFSAKFSFCKKLAPGSLHKTSQSNIEIAFYDMGI
jgi:hypothetical protein